MVGGKGVDGDWLDEGLKGSGRGEGERGKCNTCNLHLDLFINPTLSTLIYIRLYFILIGKKNLQFMEQKKKLIKKEKRTIKCTYIRTSLNSQRTCRIC